MCDVSAETDSDEDRRTILLLATALATEMSLSVRQVCERAGVDEPSARRWLKALGRPVVADPEALLYGDPDVQLVRRAATYRERGLTDDELLPAARAIGRGISGMADALGSLLGEALLLASDGTDADLARAYAEEARRVVETDGEQLMHLLSSAVVDRFRSHAVAVDGSRAARLRGAQDVAVAFVDLVGFTSLGESVSPLELSEVAEELAACAAEVTTSDVRLIKTIGDSVMFVGADASELVAALAALFRRWHDGDRGRPRLRAGMAYGRAVPHAGDWFGPAVNLASRVTAVARPGGLSATADARHAADRHGGRALPWRLAAPRRFKGVRGVVRLHRLSMAVPDRHDGPRRATHRAGLAR